MQDDNRMDESFIDRAWTNMNIMLDQEMPAREKKKRRFILLWFLSPLLLLGGTGYWHWASTSSIMPVSHFKISVLKNNLNKQFKNVISIAKVEVSATDTFTTKRKNQSSLVAPEKEVNRQDSTTPREKSILPIAEALENNIPKLVISKEPTIQRHVQKLALLNEIPSLNSGLLKLQDFIDIPLITSSSRTYTKPSIGLAVGGRSGNGLAFAGGYVGFFTDFNLGKRIGITTGMRMDWQHISFDDRSLGFSSVENEMTTIDMDNSGNYMDPFFLNESIDYTHTGNFLQLEWPLKLSYDLDVKWRLMVGGYINFVLDGYEKIDGTAESQNTVTGSRNLVSFTKQRAISQKMINLWNGGLELGALYRIAPKWQLNLDISYGLNNWLKEGNDNRRSAQLGIRYQIN